MWLADPMAACRRGDTPELDAERRAGVSVSRGHRIHSSGDYKNPPPAREHHGLRNYHRRNAGPRLEIPPGVRGRIGAAFVRKLLDLDCRVIAAAVGKRHGHFLVEMPDDYLKER